MQNTQLVKSTKTNNPIEEEILKQQDRILKEVNEEAVKLNKDKEWAKAEFTKRFSESAKEIISKKVENQSAQIEKLSLPSITTNNEPLKVPPKVTTTEYKNVSTQDTQTKDDNKVVSQVNSAISLKTDKNSFKYTNVNISLKEDGSLSIINKDQKSNDISSNFKALFLGDDNILRDKDGNVINEIKSATGPITSSFVKELINNRYTSNEKILSIKDQFLNHFTHEDKQIVFVKGPPNKTNTDKISNQNTIDIKENTKFIPFTKHKYNEQINGVWQERHVYLRKNVQDNKEVVEIFKGKDKNGKEIWIDIKNDKSSNFAICKIDKSSGKFLKENGEEIKEFKTTNGYQLNSDTVKNLIDNKNLDIKSIKNNHINNLLLDGKRPIFL